MDAACGTRATIIELREWEMTDSMQEKPVSAGATHHQWRAQMVRPTNDGGVGTRAPFLRKSFALQSVPSKAILRITALGVYRAFINGKPVGDDLLTPGWTSYQARLSYQVYEVSKLLKAGENVIDIWLGDGWYRAQVAYEHEYVNTWGTEVAALAELSDGEGNVLLATDASWRSGFTAILKNGIYFGERYDARDEGLSTDYGSEVIPYDFSRLVPYETSGVKELAPLAVVKSWTDAGGRTIYDFGQNSAGYVRFTAEGARGAQVLVEHAEILDENGEFWNANFLKAEALVEYTLKGGGPETYAPSFTFMGFRYARVTIQGEAKIRSIISIPISSVVEVTGSFNSANPLVNRLVQNTIWSQRTNFIEIPSDCPQRAERLGWTGDIQIFAPTACYLHDSHTFLKKWLNDVMVDQRPDGGISFVSPDPFLVRDSKKHPGKIFLNYGSTGWGDAIVNVPWALYEHYGDLEVLKTTLPAMLRWSDFVWNISNGPIVRPPVAWNAPGFTFGDWLQPTFDYLKALPTMGDDAAATIYLYISAARIAKVAELVGNHAEAGRMQERARRVKEAFQAEFITPSGRVANDDQSSYALSFLYDLIPDDKVEAAKGYFRATVIRSHGHIQTGFIGTPALLPALVKIGEVELAASIFLQEGTPGWLAQVKRGATTIWERWDGLKEDGSIHESTMNSFNHYAYGAVCQWLFEAVAGFRPDVNAPGFKKIVFEPVVIPRLSPVAAHYDSVAGRIEAGWSVSGSEVHYDVVVPSGAQGEFVLSPRFANVTIDGNKVAAAGPNVSLAPGEHHITFQLAA